MADKSAKQCQAETKNGTRCKNAALSEYNGLCRLHGKHGTTPGSCLLDKSAKVTSIVANSISIASGVIGAVTFISAHWDSIRHVLSSLGVSFITDYEWTSNENISESNLMQLAHEANRLTVQSREILSSGVCSKEDELKLRKNFVYWFKSLPDDVQEKAKDYLERMEFS